MVPLVFGGRGLHTSVHPIREREIAALGRDQVALPAHGPMERVARFRVERTLCANTFLKFFVVVFSDAESSFKGIQTPAYARGAEGVVCVKSGGSRRGRPVPITQEGPRRPTRGT